jgi:hypothetical protein
LGKLQFSAIFSANPEAACALPTRAFLFEDDPLELGDSTSPRTQGRSASTSAMIDNAARGLGRHVGQ